MTEDELRASIKEKKAELAALEQLRDQSSALVAHLEAMKGKFGEIKEGTAGELWRRGLPRGGGRSRVGVDNGGACRGLGCGCHRLASPRPLCVRDSAVAADVLARWSELFALVAARDSHRLVLVPQPKAEAEDEA